MEQGFFNLIRGGYLFIFVIAIILAIWIPKAGKRKLISGIVVGAIMLLPVFWGIATKNRISVQAAEEQAVVNQAGERFNELCLKAGYRINRTVENVDYLMLLKIRPVLKFRDYANQLLPGAAMAGEVFGDSYIESFLSVESHDRGFDRGGRGTISGLAPGYPRYRYVDAIDEKDGKRYRYSLEMVEDRRDANGNMIKAGGPELRREPATGPEPRYAIDYEDLIDPADRKMWIAGTKVKVVDQTTGGIIAEYLSYAWDAGMGYTKGVRAPWQYAASHGNMYCPPINGAIDTRTRYFIDRVLRLPKGDSK